MKSLREQLYDDFLWTGTEEELVEHIRKQMARLNLFKLKEEAERIWHENPPASFADASEELKAAQRHYFQRETAYKYIYGEDFVNNKEAVK